jgi:hypothetical protein
MTTYEMQHGTGQDAVNREAHAPLHAHQAGKAMIVKHAFLNPAHLLRRIKTEHHRRLP